MIKKIIGIMAVSPEGVIGNKGQLPWNYPQELAHLRNTIQGHPILMGRKTFEAMPGALLEKSTPIVFSKDKTQACFKGTIRPLIISSLQEWASCVCTEKIFMIGGAEITRLFIEEGLMCEFILTKIYKSYKGDTYLDLEIFQHWGEALITNTPDYAIYRMIKDEH